MLTMKGIHHPKGNVHCLYLHQSKGVRGLTGIEDTHNCECDALAKLPCSQNSHRQNSRTTITINVSERSPFYGNFFHQQEEIPQVDLAQSHQWLRFTQLCPEIKAMICAAQEQTM
eukprot:15360493-Ditylum_brightwellii.AAC.1